MPQRLWMLVTTLLMLAAPAPALGSLPDPLRDLVARVTMLPSSNSISGTPLELVDPLGVAARLSEPEIDLLLASDDPRALGVAIFALSEQHRPDRLLTLSHLLDDTRLSVPLCISPAISRRQPFVAEDRTVAATLRAAYNQWFGVRIATRQQFAELLDGVDPWAVSTPWVTRLRLTTEPDPLERLKAEIALLPENLRWLILMESFHTQQQYSPDEAREIIAQLSPNTRAAIDAKALPVPAMTPNLRQSPEHLESFYKLHDMVLAGELIDAPPPRTALWRRASWTPPEWWKRDK
ncbi:MAG: hypothetical protein KF684_09680 [Phycisphaeraceae bacterium]|nr:hypothetical protein [Phycisphaeraceae bacterium]